MHLRTSLALLLASCGPAIGTTDGEDSTSATDGSSSSSSTAGVTLSSTSAPSDTSGVDTSGTTSSTGADDDDDTNDDGPLCILHHHEVATPGECDGDSECCPGDKCVPSPSYSECVPLDDAPAGVGEPCVRTGVSDDCVAGAVCRGADPDTNEGRCVELCALGHTCNDSETICTAYPLQLCLQPCDPLDDAACPPTDTCLPMATVEAFACAPDESPTIAGGAGAPCPAGADAFMGCDAGHLCLADQHLAIESCAADDESGCCTRLCAMGDPMACAGIGAETCVSLSAPVGATWPDALGVGYCG